MDIRQCMDVRAKESFTASINRRRIHVKAGDIFWIVSPAHYTAQYGVVDICRQGKGGIGQGYPFTLENFNRLFEPVAE